MDNHLYETRELLAVMEEMDTVPSYWLPMFNRQINFTKEEIEFEKLTRNRVIAPLVVPTAQGRPIYKKASKVTRFRPAYVKPKDSVNESETISRQPGSLLGAEPSKEQSYQARVADISGVHRRSIERRWEWLAAKAVIDGTVTLEDQDYPRVVIDFERDPGHTVTLAAGDRWDSGTQDIIGDIQDWRKMMRRAKFGGGPNRMTMGTSAWAAFQNDPAMLDLLDTQKRGSTTDFKRGPLGGADVEFVGTIDGDLELYVYSDYYELQDGTKVDFLDPRDVVLTGPGLEGVRCFGAILDHKAQFQALPIFPKMWDSNDPPVTYIMSQSAPLMVPVNPNTTMKARVVA
jgi:hypothetical protein